MYLYFGRMKIGPLVGYLWLLGRRLYLKLGWRPRDTVYLGSVDDLLGVAVRVRRLVPRPLPVRQLVAALVDALKKAYYVASRCRDSPRWKIRAWEAAMAIEYAASALAMYWPSAAKKILDDG
ncbi:paREP9 [Pyrobaculum islandicum DSM 4184]|uniref:PaREP9 n=1 Tax=Pyrobaculum islandicum (strain DSM 4184 / JCM 9189 / GEO3) TaxID=384616 RepID=A1RQF3_PYRIL|nr:hypothetical protein [Pyrobaculum islandicum]ABL87185.1 paREP9 [Pyrobaculum islandicum DSM 4184]